jgi:hypothetical protein
MPERRDALLPIDRPIVPGVIWGYLYWRHGFVAAEIASVGMHPFLQPALGILLAR